MFLYTFSSPYFLGKIKKILLEKTTPTMTAGVETQEKKILHIRTDDEISRAVVA